MRETIFFVSRVVVDSSAGLVAYKYKTEGSPHFVLVFSRQIYYKSYSNNNVSI